MSALPNLEDLLTSWPNWSLINIPPKTKHKVHEFSHPKSLVDRSDASATNTTPQTCYGSCLFHQSRGHYKRTPCSATTNKGTPCPYSARLFRHGYKPVCHRHEGRAEPVGRCQVLELCGSICNRLANDAASANCDKHKDGTPHCYLMDLPTELRLMIFRYLFPENIDPDRTEVNVAILKTNCKIYEEASYVLYQESIFHVNLYPSSYYEAIHFLGKRWAIESESSNSQYGGFLRAKNIHFSLRELAHSKETLTSNIFSMRVGIRKFADMFDVADQVAKSLTFDMSIDRYTREDAMVGAFLIIEPLQNMHISSTTFEDLKIDGTNPDPARQDHDTRKNQQYAALQAHWKQTLDVNHDSNSAEAYMEQAISCSRLATRINEALSPKDSDFYRREPPAILNQVFAYPERPRRIIQIALQNNDMAVLENIQDVLGRKWVEVWERHQQHLKNWASPMSRLFEKEDGSIKPGSSHDLFPEAFAPPALGPDILKESYSFWDDLTLKDSAPALEDEGVTFVEDLTRVLIRKDGLTWIRMKTPGVIQQLRDYKEKHGESS